MSGAESAGRVRWTSILQPGLPLVVVGFNPGAVSAARGHYYAKPGNQFYPLLFRSGLTPRLLTPVEDRSLPDFGIGLVDLCPWRVGQSDLLTPADVARGRGRLLAVLRRARPRVVAFNGLMLFRHVFGRTPRPGPQPERIGASITFALPSTSGLVNGRWREREVAFRDLARFVRAAAAGPSASIMRFAMRPLAARRCVPCSGRTSVLKGAALSRMRALLPAGWRIVGGRRLVKTYRFPDFREAFSFVKRVAALAEREFHHPDVFLAWGRVTLSIWTHAVGGLTENDFVLAAKSDALRPKAGSR